MSNDQQPKGQDNWSVDDADDFVEAPKSEEMARIESFFLARTERDNQSWGRKCEAGSLTVWITLLALLPAALFLVPTCWFYEQLPTSIASDLAFCLLFLQPIGAFVAVLFRRRRNNTFPISSRLWNTFTMPAQFKSLITETSRFCCFLFSKPYGQHTADSSPAVYFVVAGSCCGGDRLLSTGQCWNFILLESGFTASILVSISGPFYICFKYLDPGNDDSFVLFVGLFLLLFLTFGWYALFQHLTGTTSQEYWVVSNEQTTDAGEYEMPDIEDCEMQVSTATADGVSA